MTSASEFHPAHFTDNTSRILCSNTMCFESVPLDKTLVPIPIPIPNQSDDDPLLFGILHFVAQSTALTDAYLDFVFNIDCSLSMSDPCSDGRSKMQHIIHTLSNIISYFKETFDKETPKLNVHITIIAFDEIIYNVVERTKVTEENYNDIIAKIQDITPRGGTNIELALTRADTLIKDIHNLSNNQQPEHLVNHIFMTDGGATSGFRTAYMLQPFIAPEKNIRHYVIGFGLDHDATLLAELSLLHNCHYYFVDTLESAGLVYSEILHTIMRRLLRDAKIMVTNGFIYNYATNEWTTQLSIGDVASENIKTFNIVSANPSLCSITVDSEIAPGLIMSYPATRIDDALLPVHLFRQRTLQLLYEATHYDETRYSPPSHLTPALIPTRYMDDAEAEADVNIDISAASRLSSPTTPLSATSLTTSLATRKQKISDQMHELMFELKAYMMENMLDDKDTAIMHHLHADLFVCNTTFDKDYGNMYCNSRLTSQGCQRQYSATANHITQPTMTTPQLDNTDDDYGDETDDNNWDRGEIILLGTPCLNLEVSASTPYVTPQVIELMTRLNK